MSPIDRRSFLGAVCGSAAAVTFSRPAGAFGLWGGGKSLAKFPVFTQPDDISCGPTCCSMVLKWYGIDAGIGPCKTKAGTRWFEAGDVRVGMSRPDGLKDCLAAYGVPATVRKGSLGDIAKYVDLDRPPILLLRSGVKTWHYVVAVGYSNGTVTINLANPSGQLETTTGTKLDGAWAFSHDMEGKKIEGRKCRVCGGEGKVGKGWTSCPTCSGSGWWKAWGGKTKCPACSGRGKWESGGARCVACNGDGKEPDWFRKAVETAGVSGHTLIVPDRGRPADGSKPADKNPPATIRYTIWNDTPEQVTFRLPSGKVYTLAPGKTGSYHNTGTPAEMKIFVQNSGREYSLADGDHKFWYVKAENRIGFDRNYKKN